MSVVLKSLNSPTDVSSEFINEFCITHEFYGITQDLVTKNYIVVLNDTCEKCEYVCCKMHFLKNFQNWTSCNEDVDKFIQDVQLSVHDNCKVFTKAIEWIPYNKFYDIEYITKDVYRAKWIDGYIIEWDYKHQNWKRGGQNMYVILKNLNNLVDVALEFRDELSTHDDYEIFKKTIEWISYNKFYDIEYITKDVYRAKWIDGYIIEWDYKHQNWKRGGQNMPKAEEIKKLLSQWLRELSGHSEFDNYTGIQQQIKESEITNSRTLVSAISTNLGISFKTHSEAIYTSRLLNFNNLPEPKNTDDYYKENDDIISIKSSESLLIDISQLKKLKINDNNLSEQKYSEISMESQESLQIDISQLSDQNSDFEGKVKIKG
ncbi:kinase-like domain-containing protein [Rhizophagus irregularis DAOM 181602=DAOM 197198]|nr:kinase-like domain-containing protein [Rhizophagus irregularis DAOM 181602=DAOM 197198]